MGLGKLDGTTINYNRKFRWYLDVNEKHGKEICHALHVKFEERHAKDKNLIHVKAYFVDEREAKTCKEGWAYLCDGYATAGLYDAAGQLMEAWDFDLITTINSRIMIDGDAYVIEAVIRAA